MRICEEPAFQARRPIAKPEGTLLQLPATCGRAVELLDGGLRWRFPGERHTEQSADGQNGDHDPGFVDRLNERSLFDQRLHHRERRALEWASGAVHEHVEGYADKLGRVDIPGRQSLR